MLTALHVSNYILIDSLDISFPEGLVIITGETGAGKSILLGALSLVLGAKADAGTIGPHAENCVVEATFDTGGAPALLALLKENDLPVEDGELVLRRVVSKSGRSRCFANDEPVSVGVLQELSTHLVDIHSQHQTLRLSDERFRMEALDLYAGARGLREQCADAWHALQEARHALESLREQRAAMERERDYNEALWQKLDQAGLREGELEELEAEQKQLSHAEELKEILCAVEALLGSGSEEEAPLPQRLRDAERLIRKAGKFLPALDPLAERMESARLELEDMADEVTAANARMDVSPERLAWVEERLGALYALLKKHGVGTVAELMAERDRLALLLEDASSLDSREAELQKAAGKAGETYQALAEELHGKRAAASASFADAIQARLRELELDHAVFQVALEPVAAGPHGKDAVQFLFSSASRTPVDVARSASGGELSRIMLSLKALMAGFTKMPTMVFDEIDTGVSGSAADKMGSLVCRMGRDMQVFAITHLPQVAAKGNAHYVVSKADDITSIRQLGQEERVLEIARMLSGSTITEAAIANARTLLN